MKQLTTYSRTVQYLVKMFKAINEHYFDNVLELPTITIQTSRKAYGYVSTSKVWLSGEDRFSYELNISAEYLSRPIEEVAATLVHEAVHLYCLKKGIKDTSNRGVYHNRKFRDIAVTKDLEIEHHKKYGYSITKPMVGLLMFCEENGFVDIQIQRGLGFLPARTGSDNSPTAIAIGRKPSSTRKYQCQNCGNSFRATKDINVLCLDCNEVFVRVT